MTNMIEYLCSALVMVMIVTVAIYSVINALRPVHVEVLRRDVQYACDALGTQLLGYAGNPPNWGSLDVNVSEISGIGLADTSEGSVLTLDQEKVLRLVQSDIGTYIAPEALRGMLNLQGRYDFNIRLTPALNISIIPIGETESIYSVVVTTHDGVRVANVNLTTYVMVARLLNDNGEDVTNYTLVGERLAFTDWNGEYVLDYTDEIMALTDKDIVGTVIVAYADFYGLRSVGIRESHGSGEILSASIVGNKVILGIEPEYIPKGASHLEQEVVEGVYNGISNTDFVDVTEKTQGEAPWVVNYGGKNWRVYELSYLEPDMYFTAFVVKHQGKYCLVVSVRIPDFREIGTPIPTGTEVAMFRRLVLIEGDAYYFSLYLWKVSWSV